MAHSKLADQINNSLTQSSDQMIKLESNSASHSRKFDADTRYDLVSIDTPMDEMDFLDLIPANGYFH